MMMEVLSLPPPQAATSALISNDTTVRRANWGVDRRVLLLDIIGLVPSLNQRGGLAERLAILGGEPLLPAPRCTLRRCC
jgi:hypothetical protein